MKESKKYLSKREKFKVFQLLVIHPSKDITWLVGYGSLDFKREFGTRVIMHLLCCVFISIHLKVYFLISSVMSLTHCLLKSVFDFLMFVNFLDFLLLLMISSSISLQSERTLCMI